ncbi:M56 family metallopeptidase [Clostridium estertheticum]|uniref:M56 family metallopeptidase n=1 Tax=Clostridium estertheticum TaxID=238834 RepID=UPI0013E900CE|nr:M56 family metallopeptidase [Clostridium estertheticum]MBZ9685453.1 M56 family metallopeptidase [Clostridium estertheticum]
MTSEIVKLLLSLSLSGSILAVLIFAVKPFIKHKLSKTIQYYIWIVVILRLILPFSFETSIMNELFYGNQTPVVATSQGVIQPVVETGTNISKSNSLPNVQENVSNAVNNGEVVQGRHFVDLFNRYSVYLWLLGIIITLIVNLTGYGRFLKYLNGSNISATNRENEMLVTLLNGRRKVRLFRNRFLNTPMLIGIARPYIIIPDASFSETQLKNILLHEIVHLKRFDIAVKWLTMIASSIHWFNPLMYFIKKEINSSCELACDEAVIKNLSPAEKQAYGDTLISVVAQYKYPNGILQVTMCEEKKGLKERLVAIMNHSRKSRGIIILSVILLGCVIFGALYLGAGVGKGKVATSSVEGVKMSTYNLEEISKYKTPFVGDNSKVSAIVNNLPVPDSYFKQQYISMVTDKQPYKLNVYYEPKENIVREWPIVSRDNVTFSNISKNALVLFCMIDNLDEVTFAFRGSQSDGKIDELKYNYTYSFIRAAFEKKYGDLSVLGGKADLLKDALVKELTANEIDIQTQIDKHIELSPIAEIKLPYSKANVSGNIEKLVYDAAVKQYCRHQDGFTVVAPTIFGSYEEGNKLKVFVFVLSTKFSFIDKTLSEVSGSDIPAAITYTKNANGSYTLDEYVESMDGSYYSKSIKNFCIMPVSKSEIKGVYDKILGDSGGSKNRSELLRKNLIEYLKLNNQKGIVLKLINGELVPLT